VRDAVELIRSASSAKVNNVQCPIREGLDKEAIIKGVSLGPFMRQRFHGAAIPFVSSVRIRFDAHSPCRNVSRVTIPDTHPARFVENKLMVLHIIKFIILR